MTEYMILVKTLEVSPTIASVTAEEVTEQLTAPLTEISQGISQFGETLLGGGWEVVSHDLAKLNDHLVVTFLFRR